MIKKKDKNPSPLEKSVRSIFPDRCVPHFDPVSAAGKEIHERGKIEYRREYLESIRKEIINEFGIPPNNVFIEEPTGGEQRKIRIFTIIRNRANPQQIYYAEGGESHADLWDRISAKTKGMVPPRSKHEEFVKQWILGKGFIDPFGNAFRDFSAVRSVLETEYAKEHKNSKPNFNWFLFEFADKPPRS